MDIAKNCIACGKLIIMGKSGIYGNNGLPLCDEHGLVVRHDSGMIKSVLGVETEYVSP